MISLLTKGYMTHNKRFITINGKMETNPLYDPTILVASLEKTRRELKDMISGNTRFHVDEFSDVIDDYIPFIPDWNPIEIL